MRPLGSVLAAVLLATAIHVDWHVARPAHHQLSLGLPWHWLLAVPVFAIAAWYVAGRRPLRPVAKSVLLLGAAVLLGAVVEPAYEYWLGGATYDWAFGPERTWGAVRYVATGLLTYAVIFALLRKRSPGPSTS